MTLEHTLDLVAAFRRKDDDTPIILMGYYNPVYIFGVERFLERARAVGVDGLIVVDLPPEEDEELCLPARAVGLDFIRLATPTTDAERLPTVLANTSGFLYYVSIAGITGTATPSYDSVASAVARFRAETSLPIAVGFGVNTAENAAANRRLGRCGRRGFGHHQGAGAVPRRRRQGDGWHGRRRDDARRRSGAGRALG